MLLGWLREGTADGFQMSLDELFVVVLGYYFDCYGALYVLLGSIPDDMSKYPCEEGEAAVPPDPEGIELRITREEGDEYNYYCYYPIFFPIS